MADSASASRARSVGVWLGLVLALALGLWPHLESVGFAPMTLDSVLWISRGALYQPDWAEWVFRTHHFNVGYRPVSALSYSLDYAIGGLNPVIYRLTDLALHFRCSRPQLSWGGSRLGTRGKCNNNSRAGESPGSAAG